METIVFQYCWDDGIEFKSYYVVWKLYYFYRKENIATSLNRTMQYGNYSGITKKENMGIV